MSNISRFIGNERGDKICHEDDGCPTELAVLKRFWREKQASSLPEEVDNLVELLDNCSVPCEDSLGVALSLVGRVKQYEKIKTGTLREQVEKLENRLNKDSQEFTILCAKETEKVLREQLAALAEQNAKMRKALTKWRYLDGSYNWRCGHCGNEVEDEHKEGCALSLPDLASPVLNRIRAEAMEEAADICSEKHSLSGAEEAIRARAAELEKTND